MLPEARCDLRRLADAGKGETMISGVNMNQLEQLNPEPVGDHLGNSGTGGGLAGDRRRGGGVINY